MQAQRHRTSQGLEPVAESEAALLANLRAGRQEAFTELVERHSPTVYNLALRMLGDHHEAEEVLQETFISAFRALDRFEGRSRLSTWLYRIAYNAALMRLRKRSPVVVSLDQPDEDEEEFSAPLEVADWGAVPETLLLSGELREVLSRALSRLPENLRTIFVLRDIEGLSTAEAAAVLSITETNAKVRLHRARLALREALTEYFAGAGVTTYAV